MKAIMYSGLYIIRGVSINYESSNWKNPILEYNQK